MRDLDIQLESLVETIGNEIWVYGSDVAEGVVLPNSEFA